MRSFSIALAAIALVAVSFVDEAAASCANACSGHGTCGDYDSCACYTNWQGPDCSLRTCPHHYAWATTSKGDLNFDGDVNDATVYDPSTKFADSGVAYVATQAGAGGDWEGWPSTFNDLTKDEGHFYMECANRGTCDRKIGACKCFEGYTGAACQRTTCPESCNGRGVCKSVSDQKAGFTYSLWDADMSHSCVCDKGYSGPSCADRSCPVGDDPMTMDQQFETQWIEISAPRLSGSDYSFSGNIRLTYTDAHGETYQTDAVPVAPYEGSATGTTDGFASALNGLPNNQLSGVTVTEGYCQTAIPGTFDLATANTIAFASTAAATYDPSTLTTRCDFTAAADKITKILPQSMGGAFNDRDDGAITLAGTTTQANVICYTLTNWYCNRYKVTFAATPGDHVALTVDTTAVAVNGETADQGATGITHTVADTLQLGTHHANGIQLGFTAVGQTLSSTASCATCTITASTKVIALANAGGGDGAKYEVDERIIVTCNAVAWGTFTVASVATDAVTVVETIKDCASSNGVAVSLASYVLDSNTYLNDMIGVGDRLIVDNFASIPPTIASFDWDITRTPPGRIFLSGAYVGDDANSDETGSSKGAHTVKAYGTGTTENNECSDRGVCNVETGACKCFKGYAGKSCSTQNALST